MKHKYLRLLAVLITAALLMSGCGRLTAARQFSQWNREGVIRELISYVEDVTNRRSENYIPAEDRIAVFDLDGTLVGEQGPIYFEWMLFCQRVLNDPDCEATPEMKELAERILQAGLDKSIPEDIEEKESLLFGEAFAGMTVEDYRAYVRDFLQKEADGFDRLTYGDAWFRPMVQVLSYLEKKGFTVYICSGTDRDADRVLMDEFYHLPYYHVIGTDCYNEGSLHDDENYLDYQYEAGEEVMRDDTRIVKNVKSAKIMQMAQEIGQRPVLAFGNSSGDQSMFTYTAGNETYRTAVFCILPDDDVREYANAAKTEKLTAVCEERGWFTVSMQHDFLTLYGEGVVKNPGNMAYTEALLAAAEK